MDRRLFLAFVLSLLSHSTAADLMGSCPSNSTDGSQWYECYEAMDTGGGSFFGCCTINPCSNTPYSCPTTDLRAAGLGTGSGPDGGSEGASDDASWYENKVCPPSSDWYTCKAGLSFQGCCATGTASNPCLNGGVCAQDDLYPAAFASMPYYSSAAATSTSANGVTETSMTASATSTTSAAVSTTTVVSVMSSGGPITTIDPAQGPTSGASSSPSASKSNIGAIAGGAVGGAVALIAAAFLFWFCHQRKQKQNPLPTDAAMTQHHESPASPETGVRFLTANVKPYTAPRTTKYNDEAYYPGQPIFGVPNATKTKHSSGDSALLSPGPPPYQSPMHSPSAPNMHEIDSNIVHEAGIPTGIVRAVEIPDSPKRSGYQRGSRGIHGSVDSDRGEAGDFVAELPHTPRIVSRRPIGMGISGVTGLISEARESNNGKRGVSQ